MNISELLKNKSIKPKEKTEILANLILDGSVKVNDLIVLIRSLKDSEQATCIEALEFASKQNPKIATPQLFDLVSETLLSKAPRVKWESAKVIANTAALFQNNLDKAILNLLHNTEHTGTVVRWSAALALSEILKLKTPHQNQLIPAIQQLIDKEEKNSIKKIYQAGLKKIGIV